MEAQVAELAERPTDRGLSRAAHESETSLHDTLDRLSAAAYTCDPDGLITYYNRVAATLWGREPRLRDPADRFCGSFKLYTPSGEPLAHDRCWMALALLHRRAFDGFELVIEQPNGDRRTALALANPIVDEQGVLVGSLNVLIDISEGVASDDAPLDADRSPTEFIATLAHELRNPLAPIRNALYLLQHLCPRQPDIADALAIIDRQTRTMARLVDDLTDVSRIERRKLELHSTRVDLAEVIRKAIETSRPLYDAAEQHLVVSEPSTPVCVSADPARLAQAVSNLLNNASKYSDRGAHAWLDVHSTASEAVITVADNGIGIPPNLLPKVFELFAQGLDGSARVKGGLGIGLTLARLVVEMHGGTLHADSDGPGKGSRFTIRLPLAR